LVSLGRHIITLPVITDSLCRTHPTRIDGEKSLLYHKNANFYREVIRDEQSNELETEVFSNPFGALTSVETR